MEVKTVLCAVSSPDELQELAECLRQQSYRIIATRSAAECISQAAELRPDAILLDEAFAVVDNENVIEYINSVSPSSAMIILAGDPTSWRIRPPFVTAVVRRGNEQAALAILSKLFRPPDSV